MSSTLLSRLISSPVRLLSRYLLELPYVVLLTLLVTL